MTMMILTHLYTLMRLFFYKDEKKYTNSHYLSFSLRKLVPPQQFLTTLCYPHQDRCLIRGVGPPRQF